MPESKECELEFKNGIGGAPIIDFRNNTAALIVEYQISSSPSSGPVSSVLVS